MSRRQGAAKCSAGWRAAGRKRPWISSSRFRRSQRAGPFRSIFLGSLSPRPKGFRTKRCGFPAGAAGSTPSSPVPAGESRTGRSARRPASSATTSSATRPASRSGSTPTRCFFCRSSPLGFRSRRWSAGQSTTGSTGGCGRMRRASSAARSPATGTTGISSTPTPPRSSRPGIMSSRREISNG